MNSLRVEWQSYWQKTFRYARSVYLALGVSLVFWAFQIPGLPKSDYILSLGISCIYGITIFGFTWALYSMAAAISTHFSIKTGRPIKLGWAGHLPLGMLGMTAGLLTAKWIKAIILEIPFSTSGLLDSLLVGFFITSMFIFYYAYKNSQQENLELIAAKAESELHVLKNQMQPHFLFNSLNSLSELIETNKDSASDMTMKLSDLYREILENSKQKFVSLDSEISIIKKYLELEKMRFGERLRFVINVPKSALQIWVPPLMLQTLVENSVKHGIANSLAGGTVEVSIRADDHSGYLLRVVNSVSTKTKSAGSSTGLANTKARLDLLYGSRHGFAIKNQGPTFEASFWFSGEALGV